VPYVLAPRGMLIRGVITRKSRWVKTAWIHLIERRSLADASAVHVTADMEGEELKALGLPTPHLAVIPNGVEWPLEGTTLPPSLCAKLPERYVLFLGRISWKKGLDRLIAAWQWVPDVPLVIAGNDDEAYRPKLEVLIQSLGLSDRVRFLGPVADSNKWA